jgi:hypothetical protein
VFGERVFDVEGAFCMSLLLALMTMAAVQDIKWQLVTVEQKEFGPVSFWCFPEKGQLHSIIAAQTAKKTAVDYNYGAVGTKTKTPIRFDTIEFFLNENRYRGSVVAKFRGTNSQGFVELVLTDNPTRANGGGTVLGDLLLDQSRKKITASCGSNMRVPPRFMEAQ